MDKCSLLDIPIAISPFLEMVNIVHARPVLIEGGGWGPLKLFRLISCLWFIQFVWSINMLFPYKRECYSVNLIKLWWMVKDAQKFLHFLFSQNYFFNLLLKKKKKKKKSYKLCDYIYIFKVIVFHFFCFAFEGKLFRKAVSRIPFSITKFKSLIPATFFSFFPISSCSLKWYQAKAIRDFTDFVKSYEL